MTNRPVIAIFAQSGAVRAYLAEIAVRTGCDAVWLEKKPVPAALILAVDAQGKDIPRLEGQKLLVLGEGLASDGVRVMKVPVRAGDLLAAIRRAVSAQEGMPARLEIAGHILDTRENLWIRSGESPVRLTEKEVAILCYLKESKASGVSRQTLLDAVWAYADGVETHTLETHIYRLRQKIEHDPSSPEILLTAEDGYRLGG